tara:strand:+ start:317 stop:508 length:192 start_codon:yes stop_codon:yes gene_type:complete
MKEEKTTELLEQISIILNDTGAYRQIEDLINSYCEIKNFYMEHFAEDLEDKITEMLDDLLNPY